MLTQVSKSNLVKFVLIAFLAGILSQCTKQLVNDKLNRSEAARRHIEVAKAYIDERNTRKALSHLQKSEEFEDKSAELFHTYALIYRAEGDASREQHYYRKALREDKTDARIKNNYGSFLCFHNKASKGIKYLVDASEDYSYAGRSEAYVNRGFCELNLGDEAAAESSFQQALRLNTPSTLPLLELADIYFKKNDFRLANLYYQQFTDKNSQPSPRSLWLGIQIARTQENKNAESSYALLLEKRFSESDEYQAYLKSTK